MRGYARLASSAVLAGVLTGVALSAAGGAGSAGPGQVGALTQLAGEVGCLASQRVAGCGRVAGISGVGLAGTAVRASADGRSVYVVGHGSLAVLNRIAATGALSQPPGKAACIQDPKVGWYSKQCVPIVDLWPSALATAPDGRALYVASASFDYGGGKDDEWTRFDVLSRDSRTGYLERSGTPGACFDNPAQPGPLPRGCTPARGLDLPLAVVASPDGRHVYVGSFGGISVFRRIDTGGLQQLPGPSGCLLAKPRTPQCSARPAGTDGAFSLAMSPDGKNVYALLYDRRKAPYPNLLLTFARDSRTGALTQRPQPAGCLSGLPRSGCRVAEGLTGWWWDSAMAVAPDGRNVYVGNSVAVFTFTRSADGTLQPFRGSTKLHRTSTESAYTDDIAVSPDGHNVYVAFNGALLTYARDSQTGALSSRQCIANADKPGCRAARSLGSAAAVTVTRDGRNVYVAGSSGDYPGITQITAYSRRTAP